MFTSPCSNCATPPPCGPDSVTAQLLAEIMRRRPFLLLQSDAVLKELAHLENRVNTYVKQLELGLHEELQAGGAPVEVLRLRDLRGKGPIDRERDVIYLPTVADNRVVASVLRGAGFTCIDNWDETIALRDIVREGRRFTGDSVCAPLAAVYGDLVRAVEDFRRRAASGDPLVRGKRRLLYIDNQGDGPCRQGQYAEVHTLLSRAWTGYGNGNGNGHGPGGTGKAASADGGLPDGVTFHVMVGHERDDYNVGIDEWTMFRANQSIVAHAVLQDLLFAGGARCRDAAEYARMQDDHRALKRDLYERLERFSGPGPAGRRVTTAMDRWPIAGLAAKYFTYRLHGRDLTPPIARFARAWIRGRPLAPGHLRIHVSGEVYMRVAQAEALFEKLLAIVGFRRFEMTLSPLWAYLEYLPEYQVEIARERLIALDAGRRRASENGGVRGAAGAERGRIRRARVTRAVLRRLLAGPLYRAAGLPLPPTSRELLDEARDVLPTLRPHGELGLYVGEALDELRGGADLFLSLAPSGCMVTSMGEVLTPAILQAAGPVRGRIQSLFSADGDIDEELLALAILKVQGPEQRHA